VIVFGFHDQEVVDLESRKMAAKNVILGGNSKKKQRTHSPTKSQALYRRIQAVVILTYRRLIHLLRQLPPCCRPECNSTPQCRHSWHLGGKGGFCTYRTSIRLCLHCARSCVIPFLTIILTQS
jgi:hypothetical protein